MHIARLVGLVVLVVLLQTIAFPNLRIFGVVPDVGLVVAVAVAYYAGPESGAVFGFVQGLAIDLFVNTPFGLSALVFGITAFVVGLLVETLVRTPRFMPIFLALLGGIIGGGIFVSVGALVGQEQLFEWASLRIILIAAIYDALIAPVLFVIARRTLHPPIR